MRTQLKKILLALMVTLPLVFVMVFFGYLPVHYDIRIKTDNIVGEGICTTYGSQLDGRTMPNKTTFYFGSVLKTATIQGSYFDAGGLNMVISDVSEFDILEIDSLFRGIRLSHNDLGALVPDGTAVEATNYKLTSRDGRLHVDVINPNEEISIEFDLPFIPLWFWLAYAAAILLAAVLLAVLFARVMDRFAVLRLPLLSAACIAVTLLAGIFFCDSLAYMQYDNFLLNWLLFFAAALALNALTLPFLGTVLVMAFTTAWYIANYFVISLRGKPIMPADIKALGTAEDVMGRYSFIPDWRVVAGVAVVLLYAVVLIQVWKRSRPAEKPPIGRRLLRRGIALAAAVALFFIGVHTQTFRSLETFAWDTMLMRSFHEEGMLLTYLKSAFNSGVRTPEGYSRERVDACLREYQARTPEPSDGVRPTRIIMVMNEAFSDLRTVGLDPAIDVMPFIDSLQENTAEGSVYVGIYGGGTCNTEFEALTGNTLAFLGVGAYPFTENVTDPLFSLASYFRDMGYLTEAFHPNRATNWNRNMAYPNLGFGTFHSIEDFGILGEPVELHELPADVNDYRYIETVDAENRGTPRFLFDVTMQNHSPYERWQNVEKAASVAENGGELYVDTQVYLSLIKASDDAVRQLVETCRESDEPTMIVFFGDHQPGLPGVAMKEIYTDIRGNIDYFKAKFFIWTNYDTPEWHGAQISANYLPWLILERGNFPLPPFVRMLGELYEKYPVITSQGVIDSAGNLYSGVAEVMDDPLIQKYQYVQYANLFDEIDPAWFAVGESPSPAAADVPQK